MIISCPNCFARYTLPQGAIPDEGRKVRCSSCSNMWDATPENVEAPVVEAAEEVVVSDDTADKLAAIRSAMEDEASNVPEGSIEETDENTDDIKKLGIEEETEETEDEAEDGGFNPENFGFDEDEGLDEADVEPALEGGTSDLDEIDDRFADDPGAADDIEFSEPFPADDFDDDEDFDDVVTRRRRKQREEAEVRTSSRRSQVVMIGWVFLILVVGTVFALFVAIPDKVVTWWPAAQGLYDTVGVSSEPDEVHADVTAPTKVDIKIYPTGYQTVDGINALPLKGKFVNMGTRTVSIPLVAYVLTDKDGAEVAKGTFCLPSRMIMKNNSVEFEHIVKNAPVNVAKISIDIKRETNANGQVIDSCAKAE